MYPLIEIKSIPIEIRMKTTNASLEYTRGTAEMEISRSDKGGLDIRSRPIKLQLDTFEQRGTATGAVMPAISAPMVSSPVSGQGASALTPELQQTAYEATSAYSDQGQIMLNARFGQSLMRETAQMAQQPAGQEASAPAEQDAGQEPGWEDGQMQIRYEMDKMNFDWKIDKGSFEFTPGDIEVIVEQRPSVVIKYIGGPIYVPRSADPNYEPRSVDPGYEPVDVKA